MTPVSQLRGPSREHLAWPFFDARHGEYAAALDAFAAGLGDTHGGDVDETCRSLVRRLGAAGLLEASVAGNQPDAVIDSRLICHRPRDAGLAQRACRFRLCNAGTWHRSGGDCRFAGIARAGAAEGAARRVGRGLCPVGEGSRFRRCRHGLQRPARRRPLYPGWREDLDFQRRHRRRLYAVCANRRGAGRAGHFGLCGASGRSWVSRLPTAST